MSGPSITRQGRAVAVAALCCAALSCGYHPARRGGEIPVSVVSMAVPVFKNETYEPALEDTLTDAFIQALAHHRWVRIVQPSEADAVLLGTVKEFQTSPISFAATDFAAEMRARVKCKLVLRDRNGKILWEDKEVSLSEEYQVTPDIFASEANKRRAIERLAADLAEEVQDRLFSGF